MSDSTLPPAPPPPPPPGGVQPGPAPMSPQDERTWATLTHVGGIFFSFVPALIVYLVAKDRGPFIREHSATALNFQLSMLIYVTAGLIVSGVLTLAVIGIFLLFIVPFAYAGLVIVFSIIAAVRANGGQPYRYPLTITFLR